jgi:hypothetical protein
MARRDATGRQVGVGIAATATARGLAISKRATGVRGLADTSTVRGASLQNGTRTAGPEFTPRQVKQYFVRVPGNLIITASVLVLAFVLLRLPASAIEPHQSARHPSAVHHQPVFITPPGETDVLLVVIALVLVAAMLAFGVFFFWLHNLPERLVHNSTKAQFDIVAALALLSLLTHIHLFWVLALLIALVKIPMPDFTGLLGRIAGSLEKIADTTPGTSIGRAPSKSSDPPLQGM